MDLLTEARRARLRPGTLALWNLGGAGFLVRSARVTLLIDPFTGEGTSPDWVRAVPAPFPPEALGEIANLAGMLMTHEHDDHADPVTLRALGERTQALAVGPSSCIEVARQAGVPEA